ncbi:hypothetical protein LCGC14_0905480 [marine sediment metagenome]|uniref:Uncharacterized protein n=1 Tax=marine sediment metagenome TaxID=412755 RepID=A0A0F9NV77_9ZZZZ|nr:hypothetical protein [bacterium]
MIYTNKKGASLFKVKEGDKIPRLLEDEVYTALDMNIVNKFEIKLNNQTYSLDITPIMEGGYANIYGMDITERNKAEEAIQQRNLEISALSKASKAVLEFPDFEKSSRAIFESCVELIGATSGYVALLTPDNKEN